MGAARVGRLRRTDGRVIESFEQYGAFALASSDRNSFHFKSNRILPVCLYAAASVLSEVYSRRTAARPASVHVTIPFAVAIASTSLSCAPAGTTPGSSICASYASATNGGLVHPRDAHFASYRSRNAS